MNTPENPSQDDPSSLPPDGASPAAEEPAKPNFEVASEWRSPVSGGLIEGAETLSLPPANQDVVRAALDEAPEDIGKSNKAVAWATVLSESVTAVHPADGGVSAARRSDANWVQEVPSGAGPLRAAVPKMVKKEGVSYTGEAARELIRSRLRLGTSIHVPLWASGFWVTISSPSEDELLELQRRIAAEKISVGRSTYGLMFANTQVYTTNILLEFVMDHVVRHSVDTRKEELLKMIRMTDMSQLIWGLACSIWPNGFQYRRACIADIAKCQHVIEEKLSLAKLSWVDRSRLSESMVAHMTRRGDKSMSVESVKRYQEEMLTGMPRLVKISDDLSMMLRVPTIPEQITSGFRWVDTMEETYGRVLTMDEAARDSYLLDQTRATIMREYAHCVEKIVLNHGDGEVDEFEDVETIEITLSDCSARDDLRTTFMKQMGSYLDDSLLSLIAIPSYECPNCKKPQVVEGFRYPELIPLDVSQTFFNLLGQRIQKIQNREILPI